MKRLISLWLFITTVLFMTGVTSCDAEVLTGKVVKVSDGDTFTLLAAGNEQIRVRMYGIDAPEMKGGQPFCNASREFLAGMIAGQEVTVLVMGTDKYERCLGIVKTSTVEDVNLVMLQEGMAWHYSQFDMTPQYVKAAKTARATHKGLWSEKNPINPYQWRKDHR